MRRGLEFRRALYLSMSVRRTSFLIFALHCLMFGLLLHVFSGKRGVVQNEDTANPVQSTRHVFSPLETLESGRPRKLAYVVVVSNERYVDGPLVTGFSLVKNSALVQKGLAELVLIVAANRLLVDSYERLRCAGWTRVLEVEDLSLLAPHALLKDTYNKLHVFNLTEYSKVLLLDGDILMVRNPDTVLETNIPNEQYVGAIGSSKGNYFQTGMMLLIPSRRVFNDMLRILKNDAKHRSFKGKDGTLIRNYFKNQHVGIDKMLSVEAKSSKAMIQRAIGLHYRGTWKPWFNRENPPLSLYGTIFKGTDKELGKAYILWWKVYEQMHVKCMVRRDAYGSATRHPSAPKNYNSSESVWLMRHTQDSYVQPMEWLDVQRRNMTHPGLRVVVSDVGASCDDACRGASKNDAGESMVCMENALRFISINSKQAMQRRFPCKYVTLDTPMPHYPSFNNNTRVCHFNSLYGNLERPTCRARHPSHLRVCACLKASEYHENLTFIPVSSLVPSRGSWTNSSLENGEARETTKTSGWNADAEVCRAWVPQSTYGEADVLRSRRCALFLSHWSHMEAMPRQYDARTIKLRFHYKEGLSAIAKLEQMSFPLEPHSEYGAYAASLLLRIGMVPPTTLLQVPAVEVRKALITRANERELAFLQHEMPWMRTLNTEDMLTVSLQLWIPHKLLPISTLTPAITPDIFARWQRRELNGKADTINNALMHTFSIMVFFDYIIGNDDRSFTHNNFVLQSSDMMHLVLIDNGKSFHTDALELQDNIFSPHHTTLRMGVMNLTAHMCRLPEAVLYRALCLSRKRYDAFASISACDGAETSDEMAGRKGLDGLLLRTPISTNITWRLSEKNVLAVQRRLEKALEHFSGCAELHGLSHVIRD